MRRQARLRELGYTDYATYLRSPHWRVMRDAYWKSSEPKDCICGERDGLQLHHLTYERLGEELLYDLTPLCKPCHAMIHTLEQRGELGLDFAGLVNERRAAKNRRDQIARKHDLDAEVNADRVARIARVRAQSLPDRLRLVLAKAREVGENDIRNDRKVIECALERMERKLF